MKVSQETLVYCFIAFLVGYFFTSLTSSICRCKSIEGFDTENGCPTSSMADNDPKLQKAIRDGRIRPLKGVWPTSKQDCRDHCLFGAAQRAEWFGKNQGLWTAGQMEEALKKQSVKAAAKMGFKEECSTVQEAAYKMFKANPYNVQDTAKVKNIKTVLGDCMSGDVLLSDAVDKAVDRGLDAADFAGYGTDSGYEDWKKEESQRKKG